MEATTAAVPLAKNQGSSGITAPTEKARTDETAAFIKDEARIWGDVIRKNNIVVD